MKAFELKNRIIPQYKMLHSLRILFTDDKDFEFVGEGIRYPISRLLFSVFISEVFWSIEDHDYLCAFVHGLFVLLVGKLEPLSELCSQLVIQDFNSLVDFVNLPNLGHNIVNERLILVLVVRYFLFIFFLFIGRFLLFLLHSIIVFVFAKWFQGFQLGPAVDAFYTGKVRKHNVPILVNIRIPLSFTLLLWYVVFLGFLGPQLSEKLTFLELAYS